MFIDVFLILILIGKNQSVQPREILLKPLFLFSCCICYSASCAICVLLAYSIYLVFKNLKSLPSLYAICS